MQAVGDDGSDGSDVDYDAKIRQMEEEFRRVSTGTGPISNTTTARFA